MRFATLTLNREPNVVPMIDILLVLLIAFITYTMNVRKALDLQLPVPVEGDGAASPPIVLEVLPGPEYRLNRQPVAARDLATRIAAVFEARPTKVLFVKGDPRVRYQDVVTALDVARGAGVRVSGIVLPGQ